MRVESSKESQSPPGVFATLSAGFELTTRYPWLILIPFVLDVFFWLGPRLSIEQFVVRLASSLGGEAELASMVEQLVQNASRTNLFTLLSVPVIGVPALMGGLVPDNTPVDSPVFQIDGSYSWLTFFFILSGLGLIISVAYFSLISVAVQHQDGQPRIGFGRFIYLWVVSTFRLFALSLIFLSALVIVLIPILPVVVFLSMITGGFTSGAILLGSAFVILYFSMSLPAIVLNGSGVLKAIKESFHLVHKNILPTINLLLLIWLISAGINILWHQVDNGSWITLVSIAGHAFIGTALFVALFIFYRDRSKIQTERIKT